MSDFAKLFFAVRWFVIAVALIGWGVAELLIWLGY